MSANQSQQGRCLSLVNMPIAEKMENIRVDAGGADWIACVACFKEYRLFHLREGLCENCRNEPVESARRLKEVFRGRARLLDMCDQKFIATPENIGAYHAAQSFDPPKVNLYLFSQPRPETAERASTSGAGTGKTMLATKIIRRAIAKGLSCVFTIPEEFLRLLYGLKGIEQQRAIDRLAQAKVLVLDDIGMEPVTESGFSVRALYEVINSRWLGKRNGLVLTSNLSLDELAAHLRDDRIISRLAGMCRVIEMSGKDWRQPE
jgi:IstB-like ATP binding protein